MHTYIHVYILYTDDLYNHVLQLFHTYYIRVCQAMPHMQNVGLRSAFAYVSSASRGATWTWPLEELRHVVGYAGI